MPGKDPRRKQQAREEEELVLALTGAAFAAVESWKEAGEKRQGRPVGEV
jgi:hypothetical protein